MASICPACLIGSDEVSVQMKLFPVRTQALRLPALVLVCLLLVLGAVLGFAVCRAVPQQDRQELSDYLHQYAQATADGRGPSASALSVAAAYFRYPLAAALLGLTAAGRADVLFLALLSRNFPKVIKVKIIPADSKYKSILK